MIHAHDAAVAYSAVVRPGWFVGVAAPADRLGDARLARANQWLGMPRHRSRIGQHRLDVARERHDREEQVQRSVEDRPLPDRAHVDDDDIRVQREHPENRGHHRAGIVPIVAPLPRSLVRAADRALDTRVHSRRCAPHNRARSRKIDNEFTPAPALSERFAHIQSMGFLNPLGLIGSCVWVTTPASGHAPRAAVVNGPPP